MFRGWVQAARRRPDPSADEKRALLASWVSDAHAVPDRPALRRLDTGVVVALDDILRALKALDDDEDGVTTPARVSPRADLLDRRRRAVMVEKFARTVRRRRRDDDDEPPPCPAVAGRPVARVLTDAVGHVLGQSAGHRLARQHSRWQKTCPRRHDATDRAYERHLQRSLDQAFAGASRTVSSGMPAGAFPSPFNSQL